MAAWPVVAHRAQTPPPAGAAPAAGVPPPLTVSRMAGPGAGAEMGEALQTPQVTSQAPLQPLPVTRLEEEPREAHLDAGRTFSLRIAAPRPVQQVLLQLVRNTRFSIVSAPGVQGSFVGDLKDVTLQQALDLVLHPLGLDYAVDRSFIRVFPRRVETRIFDVNYVQTARTSRRTLAAARPGAGPSAGSRWSLDASDTANLFDEVGAGVRTLLSPDGRFNLDRQAALLQVTDYPDRLDRVGLYVEAVEQRVTRQVQIRALVVEVALKPEFAAGLDWRALRASLGLEASVSGRTLWVDLADPSRLLAALRAQGTVDVLASPQVVAMNNEPAFMRVGRHEVYFVTTSSTDAATGRVVQTTERPEAVAEGLVLSVTPQITADGIIQMSVSPSVTARAGEATSRAGDVVPVMSVREADTLVRVRAGETAVISGLMQGGGTAKTDLVVFLTPTLVAPAALARPGAAGGR